MAIPRPALIAILGGVLLAAAFALTRTVGQADDDPSAQAPAPAAVSKPDSEPASKAAADARRAAAEEADPGVPAPLARALARRQVAVLLFTQKDASDDEATAAAVRAARGLSGVEVVIDRIEDIGDYRDVVSGLGISQAPAIVVVRRDGKAEVLEGFTDAGTLAQQVEDAR